MIFIELLNDLHGIVQDHPLLFGSLLFIVMVLDDPNKAPTWMKRGK